MQNILEQVSLNFSDLVALILFITSWILFTTIVGRFDQSRPSLSSLMDRERGAWARTAYMRELRIVDTNIMQTLQQGTAFFASTSLFALGGCFALLGSSDQVATVLADVAFMTETTRTSFEIKTLGLLLIFAFAFFKFGWAYRLFNYCAILIGGMPASQASKATDRAVIASINKVTRFNMLAGRHFNSGLRAIFFSIAYAGWFIGATAMIVTTLMVVFVLIRRQYFSAARQALLLEPDIFSAEATEK